jgi:hypothetical protein
MKKTMESTGLKVARLIGYCQDLAALAMSCDTKLPKPLTPGVELIINICELTKGWKVVTKSIVDKGNLSAELWSDAITTKRLVVIFCQTGKKSYFPVFYVPVDASEDVATVAEAAIRSYQADADVGNVPRAA